MPLLKKRMLPRQRQRCNIKSGSHILDPAVRPRTMVMGILNVTPDSFSDGGRFITRQAIRVQVDKMVAAGADIIDVGGESSRPFSSPVPAAEELARVLEALAVIRERHAIPVSVDTTKALVAREAVKAGADIINDISGLRSDSAMVEVARETGAPVIVMHMQGTPADMQLNPVYDDVIADITAFFEERLNRLEKQGVAREQVILDPGIGFGKTVNHNLTILQRLPELQSLGRPIMVGHSRKAFMGKILNREVYDRDVATAAVSALCVLKGAAILRVHDVEKTVQAVRLTEAIIRGRE